MNLKNGRTTINAITSIEKIEELLSGIGANNIIREYDEEQCIAVTFLLYYDELNESFSFRLKVEVEACFLILWKEIKVPRANTPDSTYEQARRTAWKTLADLVEAQCSMILLCQAKPLQVFMPISFDIKNNKFLY